MSVFFEPLDYSEDDIPVFKDSGNDKVTEINTGDRLIPHINKLMEKYLGTSNVKRFQLDPTKMSWFEWLSKTFYTGPEILRSASGSYNNVTIYNKNTGIKYAFRESKQTLAHVDLKNYVGTVENAINSMEIIKRASDAKLSPHVYYIGFANFKTETGPDEYKVVQISKAYEMNLDNYYFSVSAGWIDYDEDNNENISDQIIDLLHKMIYELNIVCVDIKPQNCVINAEPLDVKLIDWDADFCKDSRSVGTDDSNKDLTLILLVILMANHLYKDLTNIFYDFVKENVTINNIDALSALFCNKNYVTTVAANSTLTLYQRISLNYFVKTRYNIGDTIIWDNANYNTMQSVDNAVAEIVNTKKRSIEPMQEDVNAKKRRIEPIQDDVNAKKLRSEPREGLFINLVRNAMRQWKKDTGADDILRELNIEPLNGGAKLVKNKTRRKTKKNKKSKMRKQTKIRKQTKMRCK